MLSGVCQWSHALGVWLNTLAAGSRLLLSLSSPFGILVCAGLQIHVYAYCTCLL